MKTRKMVLLVLVACGLVAAFSANSFAGNYTCSVAWAGLDTVTSSGTPTYKTAIRLVYVSGLPLPLIKSRTFYAPSGREKEFLAIALAAISDGKNVAALVDFGKTLNFEVNNLRLLK